MSFTCSTCSSVYLCVKGLSKISVQSWKATHRILMYTVKSLRARRMAEKPGDKDHIGILCVCH